MDLHHCDYYLQDHRSKHGHEMHPGENGGIVCPITEMDRVEVTNALCSGDTSPHLLEITARNNTLRLLDGCHGRFVHVPDVARPSFR